MPDSNPADAATGLPEDPIAEARRLLAAAEKMGGANAILVPTPVLSLVAALCDRLEAAEHKHCRLHRCGNCAVCKKSGRWGSTVLAE